MLNQYQLPFEHIQKEYPLLFEHYRLPSIEAELHNDGIAFKIISDRPYLLEPYYPYIVKLFSDNGLWKIELDSCFIETPKWEEISLSKFCEWILKNKLDIIEKINSDQHKALGQTLPWLNENTHLTWRRRNGYLYGDGVVRMWEHPMGWVCEIPCTNERIQDIHLDRINLFLIENKDLIERIKRDGSCEDTPSVTYFRQAVFNSNFGIYYLKYDLDCFKNRATVRNLAVHDYGEYGIMGSRNDLTKNHLEEMEAFILEKEEDLYITK